MAIKKILYVTSECKGFAVTGGLAEVAGSLPKAIMQANKNYRVKVLMPLYKTIRENYASELSLVGSTTVVLAWRSVYCGVYTLKKDGVEYYFIDNKYYFDRDQLYGYFDDGERFAYFSKAVFAAMEIMKFYPNIIHTNDWHTALVNVYLDVLYKKQGYLMDIKSVFTIHNIEYQGIYDKFFLENVIGIGEMYTGIVEYKGLINLVKGAIVCSDVVTTVSPRYAKEITTTAYAVGLEHIIRINNQKLIGIINGIDTEFYNPMTDKALKYNYGVENFEEKLKNKRELQKSLGLEVNDKTCIISVITRLASHKGIDLIIERFNEIMQENVQFVMLGTGEKAYEDKFREFAGWYPGRVATLITFNNQLSKRIYGSSDLFLMPSKMEPCGLSQMIASRYGTIPIVRATGGLFDSIKDYSEEGNGFVFKDYDSSKMLEKIKEAVSLFQNQKEFTTLAKKVMAVDFTWNKSAEEYIKMYQNLTKK
ncbi:MAG TPA: glycogen/starch synthase [Bacilli bacterium]|nr:glycogen/starch synthase [Bacilli bacterium]